MMTFQEETLTECWDEFEHLARERHRTVPSYRSGEPFHMEQERYLRYQECGVYHVVAARDKETRQMVGVFGFYLTESMHSQRPVAREDFLYVLPAYRVGRNVLRFIQYCENVARSFASPAKPVEVILYVDEDNPSGIGSLLLRLDYRKVSSVFSKYLQCPRADSAPSLAHGERHAISA